MRATRALFAAALLLPWTSIGFGQSTSAKDQLAFAAGDRVDIRSVGAKPFQLEADFTAQVNIPLGGHLVWKWSNKQLWSQEFTMDDYRQLNIRNGDKLYIARNAPFTPLRIKELEDLLNVFWFDAKYWQIKKVKRQVNDGVEMECLEIRARSGHHVWNPKRIACLDPTTKNVLSDETKDENEFRQKEFSQYEPFGEHSYPRQMKLLVNGSTFLNVKITSLRESAFDEATFRPSPGAIVRRQCENMIPPKAVKTPDPTYPRSAVQNNLGGTVTVAVTVLPDGSVGDVQLIGSAGHEMDQVTREVVQGWKFKPAMCGSEPVTADIQVEINFQLQR
jgi:TonB family protein